MSASHRAIRDQMTQFVNSSEDVLVFPPTLTKDERHFVESEAARLSLAFARKPLNDVDTVAVSKPRASAP